MSQASCAAPHCGNAPLTIYANSLVCCTVHPQREQEQARQTESMMSSGGASDVLPVYLCPEMTRSSRRIQRQKDIVAKALKSAYTRFDDTLQQDLRRVSKENQLFEAELRRQTQAANELRAWRKSNLLEQRRMHETQMQVGQVGDPPCAPSSAAFAVQMVCRSCRSHSASVR
jgi:hypothetical protein